MLTTYIAVGLLWMLITGLIFTLSYEQVSEEDRKWIARIILCGPIWPIAFVCFAFVGLKVVWKTAFR